MELTAARNIEIRREMARHLADCRQREPAIATGPNGSRDREKNYEDALYNIEYLIQAARIESKTLYNHYLLWAGTLYREHGIPEKELHDMLRYLDEAIYRHLPEGEAKTLSAYIESGIETLGSRSTESESFLKSGAPLAEEARTYLGLLLDRKREEAADLIERLLEKDMPARDIYEHIFQKCLYEIGRLWETNQITVADEHYFTAATQLIISRFYSEIFATEKTGRRLLACSVGGELHEIGVRMVADFFEMEGWDTSYLGANMPSSELIGTLKEHDYDLLAISVTMLPFLDRAGELIQKIRSDSEVSGTRIMVGGYPFQMEPDLWKRLGADGSAPSAREAVEKAPELLT